jgi:hypothetical protein
MDPEKVALRYAVSYAPVAAILGHDEKEDTGLPWPTLKEGVFGSRSFSSGGAEKVKWGEFVIRYKTIKI